MIDRLSTFFLLLVLITACGPEPEPPTIPVKLDTSEAATTGNLLADLEAEYQDIEKLFNAANLSTDSINYTCPNDPAGGRLRRYFAGDDLRMIRHDYYSGDHSGGESRYYLKNGKLFYAFLLESFWSFDTDLPGETDPDRPETKEDITEHHFFFDGEGKPISAQKKSYVVRSFSEEDVDPRAIPFRAANDELAEGALMQFKQLMRLEVAADGESLLCL